MGVLDIVPTGKLLTCDEEIKIMISFRCNNG